MQHIQDGAQSLGLILKLNLDRLLVLTALAAGLWLGSFLATL